VSYPDHRGGGEVDLVEQLDVRLLRVGALSIGREWTHADLRAPHWRLYLNKQDGARIWPAGGGVLPLQERRRYLVPAWVAFATAARDRVEHIFCHLDLPALPAAVVRECFPRPLALTRDPAQESALIRLGDAVAAGEPPGAAAVCGFKAAAYAAFSEALTGLPAPARERVLRCVRRDLPIRAALECINERPAGDCSNASLARLCGCTSDHLIRLFRRHLGRTPVQVVQERRLAVAAQALAYTDDPIEAIAERCGFANRFYFTRVFARAMGAPPAAYRRRQRA